jgi:hypothetical protein
MSGNPLVDLGELSKPATTLVEKISDAVGGVFKPYQIRRVARAEAEAERIRAESAIEITDLQQRAFHRWLTEEAKKQDNIEIITTKALPDVDSDAEPDRINDDWITNFFDKARLISDAEMQALWGKVLAGEANCPGTYSKRTVNYLASLDAEDAEMLSAVARFCWKSDGELYPVIYDLEHELYADAGITFAALSHLDDIGLVHYDSNGLSLEHSSNRTRFSYFGAIVDVEFTETRSLPVGHIFLTKVGAELAPFCERKPVAGYLDYVLGEWIEQIDAIPSSPIRRRLARVLR